MHMMQKLMTNTSHIASLHRINAKTGLLARWLSCGVNVNVRDYDERTPLMGRNVAVA